MTNDTLEHLKTAAKLKVSIVTVCLNFALQIERALKSIQAQTYPHIEHIVIDGGSSDGTVDILKKYRDGIDYFVSEPDNGIYHAMNKGIRVSTGDILFFLNADDYFWDSKVIEDIVAAFFDNPEIDLIYGNQVFDYGNSQIVKKQSFDVTRRQLAKMTIQHQTIFAKRKLFGFTRGFSEEYKIVSDYDWILKVFLIYRCRHRYIDREISVMSTRGLSWTRGFETERRRVMRNYFNRWEIYRYRVFPHALVSLKKFYPKISLWKK